MKWLHELCKWWYERKAFKQSQHEEEKALKQRGNVCYCYCGKPLLKGGEDVGHGTYKYVCESCGAANYFNFVAYPFPIRLERAPTTSAPSRP